MLNFMFRFTFGEIILHVNTVTGNKHYASGSMKNFHFHFKQFKKQGYKPFLGSKNYTEKRDEIKMFYKLFIIEKP